MSGPNHHEEVESYAERMRERDALHQADEIIAGLRTAERAIGKAVAATCATAEVGFQVTIAFDHRADAEAALEVITKLAASGWEQVRASTNLFADSPRRDQ